jgi:hypothetical protein
MKRCPQCLFLYPDSDERCDFDKTPLQVVDESEIDIASPARKPGGAKRKVLPLAGAVVLILGVVVFAIYYGLSQNARKSSAATQTSVAPAAPAQPIVELPSPSPTVSPSPSPVSAPKPSPAGFATSHSRSTTDPVSTSGPGMASRQGGKAQIVLNSGGKIDADEVWRTRDGVWYRRNGMVTLLRRNQVKAIVTR